MEVLVHINTVKLACLHKSAMGRQEKLGKFKK